MNIKSTTRTIMCKIFYLISFLGICFLMCVSDIDIEAGGLRTYFLLFLGWMLSVLITSILYDPWKYFRHLSAIICSIKLIHGYLHHKRSASYRYLYDIADECKTFREFYDYILFIYDENHKRKEH